MVAKPILTALALGFGALLVGTALAGATGGSAAAAAQGEPKTTQEDGSRRVCRDVTPSGSRLIRRICRTKAEWDRSADRTRTGVFETQTETTTQYARNPS